MSDIQEITLPSRTVFWEDINLKPKAEQTYQDKVLYARWWDARVEPWIEKVMVGRDREINPYESGVWFARGHDALRFQLHFRDGLDGFQ